GASDQFNGNIAAIEWRSAGYTHRRAYTYTYDKLNRLLSAEYRETTGAWTSATNIDRFKEQLSYDRNGNITTLKRWGKTSTSNWGLMDDLSYSYDPGGLGEFLGNRLISVDDNDGTSQPSPIAGVDHFTEPLGQTPIGTAEYTYDGNGNIISDLNKGVAITYNHMNKPTQVLFTAGVNVNKKLVYIYDASGTKLRQIQIEANGTTSKTTDYISGIQYENGVLQMKQTATGRIRVAGTAIVYECSAEALQEDHYYAFGLKMSDGVGTTAAPPHQYRYNGKEYQDELGLAWYDYGARMYDPSIGRWNGVDALAELDIAWSPYIYVGNNPVNAVDLFGYQDSIVNKDGKKAPLLDEGIPVTTIPGVDITPGPRDSTTPSSGDSNGSGVAFGMFGAAATLIPESGAGAAVLLPETVGGTATIAPPVAAILVAALAAYKAEELLRKLTDKTYVTYRKFHPDGRVYVGYTSGYGSPVDIVLARDIGHHMTGQGFGPALWTGDFVTGSVPLPTASKVAAFVSGYVIIKGREQQWIDYYGGALLDPNRSPTSQSGNTIRGVAKNNPLGWLYHQASNFYFGYELAPYTGY
ncbi:MAG: RHS repeat-associated core domain-containing protein, partial [Bacteroidetes bacterium]